MFGFVVLVKFFVDVIVFNEKYVDCEFFYFDQSILYVVEEKGLFIDKIYIEVCEQVIGFVCKGIDEVFEKYEFDVIFGFIGGFVWVIDLVGGDYFMGIGSSFLVVILGYFNVMVFVGDVFGLLMGVSFFG